MKTAALLAKVSFALDIDVEPSLRKSLSAHPRLRQMLFGL